MNNNYQKSYNKPLGTRETQLPVTSVNILYKQVQNKVKPQAKKCDINKRRFHCHWKTKDDTGLRSLSAVQSRVTKHNSLWPKDVLYIAARRKSTSI